MKKMNIILLLCLSMCFLLIDSTNEFSCIHAKQHVKIEDNNEISYVNEYDVMVKEKKDTQNNSLVITKTTNHKTYEELYLERARLDEKTLINDYAYTLEQVKILKEYDGSPIEENPQLARASAILSARIYAGGCSNTELNVMAEWSWSNAPILSGPGVTDKISFRWQGTNLSGSPINLVDNASIFAMIYYYKGGSYVTTTSINRTLKEPYGAAEMPVKMQVSTGTALRGTVTSTLRNSGSAKILEAGIVFVYGHCSILDNSISFAYKSWSSFTLSGGSVETTLVKRVTNTGSVLN